MANQEQQDYWNGEAGQRWAQSDAMMARILSPITDALLAHADVNGCKQALDVGCGGGGQSDQLARKLGADAAVTGIDISAPMLEIAREKAQESAPGRAALNFLQADAYDHNFEPNSYDLLFSRFGVMFFDDPQGAFANLRQAMRPQGRVAFCCWQSLKDNDWTWLAVQVALKHVPPPPAQDPHAPGPFAFADPDYLQDILGGAGFSDINIADHRTTLAFGNNDTLEKTVVDLARMGPVGRLLMDQPEEVQQRVIAELIEAMAPYFDDGALRLPGAVWFVTARVN